MLNVVNNNRGGSRRCSNNLVLGWVVGNSPCMLRFVLEPELEQGKVLKLLESKLRLSLCCSPLSRYQSGLLLI